MEAARPPSSAAAASRPRPASSPAGASVLRSLQAENDSLRSDLLRERQRSTQLQQELTDVRVAAEQVVRETAASSAERVRALEERCRLLADRLVARKREEQLAETARVGFVLRAQLEERRFLKRALEEMQQALTATPAPPHDVDSARATEEVHTGELYRLMLSVSDALHTHMAAAKLEKARTRLAFERATAVVDELRGAMGDATRTAFDAAVLAGHMEDDAAAGVDAGAAAGDVFEPSSFLVLPRDGTRGGSGAARATPPPPSSTHAWVAASPAGQLAVELEWVCDILKACVRGAAEVHALLGTAAEALQAPPLHLALTEQEDQLASLAFPASTGASAEMSALLRSFFHDLCTLKRHAAQQQESMARQLAHEVEQHFHSTQKSEQRIQLLEAECARLLRHAERQAPARTPARDATTQTRTRQNAGVSVRPPPAAEPAVTPERYAAPHASSESVTPWSPAHESPAAPPQPRAPAAAVVRASPPPTPAAAAASAVARHATRSLFSDHRDPPHTRTSTPPQVETGRATGEAAAPRRDAAAVAADTSMRSSRSSSFRHTAADEVPRVRVSPQRRSSAAALALWSSYHARDAHAARHPSPAALLSPPRTSSPQRLSPPPAPPPAYRTAHTAAAPRPHPTTATTSVSTATAAAASHSTPRRSATVSTPPRRPAAAALTTSPAAPAPVRRSLSNATLSSVSTSSSQRSPPPRQRHGAEGLVSSHPRSPPRSAARMTSPELPPPPLSSSPAAPPRRASTPPPPEASTHAVPAAGLHRRRLSQQLYDEAAADVFSSTSSSSGAASRHGSVRASDAGMPAPPSPRRPVRLTSRVARASPGGGRGPEVSPTRSSAGLSTPLRPTSGGAGGAGRAEPRSTPHIWRRIQAEVSWQQQQQQQSVLPSPIVGGEPSTLFGTPREVSWADS